MNALRDDAQNVKLAAAPHAHDLVVLLANREGFAGLVTDIQETIKTRLEEVAAAQRAAAVQDDARAVENFKAAGGETVEVDTAPAHETVKAAVGKALQDVDEPSIPKTVLGYAD